MELTIRTVLLNVTDLKRSIDFYRDVFDLRLVSGGDRVTALMINEKTRARSCCYASSAPTPSMAGGATSGSACSRSRLGRSPSSRPSSKARRTRSPGLARTDRDLSGHHGPRSRPDRGRRLLESHRHSDHHRRLGETLTTRSTPSNEFSPPAGAARRACLRFVLSSRPRSAKRELWDDHDGETVEFAPSSWRLSRGRGDICGRSRPQ